MKLLQTENAKSLVMAIVTVSVLFVIFLAIILSTVDAAMHTLTVNTVVIDAIAFIALVVVFYFLFDGEL